MKYAVGIDLGGTTTKFGLFSPDGLLLDKLVKPTRVPLGQKVIFDDIAEGICELTAANHADLSECCFGMGIPGAVDRNGHLNAAVDLHIYDCYPSKEISMRLGGSPVAVDNDANVAALGEMWQGGGKGYSDLLLITLGTGVGGGIVIDRKILRGTHGIAGEIGHISVNPDEPERCNCGGKGCLDQIASATGIVRYAKRFLDKDPHESLLRNIDPITAKDVVDAARFGDKVALESLTCCMSFLGKMIAAVSHVIDPEVVIIGGGVSMGGDFLLDMIIKQYDRYETFQNCRPAFSLAKLYGDAGIYGAAYLAMNHAAD
ncbi:MAG: ROK family protein [Anaerolineaceae bacterium]|nr:ROK family protein [Anaerolineaceae bacterium]